jgi:hypothetical protein
MSGGHFDYIEVCIEDVAEQICHLIANNKTKNSWGESYDFPDDVLERFKRTADSLKKVAQMARRVDYLVSGDDGIESFRERWKQEKLDD